MKTYLFETISEKKDKGTITPRIIAIIQEKQIPPVNTYDSIASLYHY
jgi:hypothetical protein